jgi:hypothetical protein
MHVSLEQAEWLDRKGAAFARHLRSFKSAADVMIVETEEAMLLYKLLSKGARTRTTRNDAAGPNRNPE